MTVNDLKKYADALVKDGKGENVIKGMCDGFIIEVVTPQDLFEEITERKEGVCGGAVLPHEILISV